MTKSMVSNLSSGAVKLKSSSMVGFNCWGWDWGNALDRESKMETRAAVKNCWPLGSSGQFMERLVQVPFDGAQFSHGAVEDLASFVDQYDTIGHGFHFLQDVGR